MEIPKRIWFPRTWFVNAPPVAKPEIRDRCEMFVSEVALKGLVERWRDIHNRDVEPGKCWHADDLEKLLEGE